MASYLVKVAPKSSLIRQSPLCKFTLQIRKSSTSAEGGLKESGNRGMSGLNLAVGLSLGLSVGLLSQSNLISRFFPSEPVPEKIVPSVDPKLIEELISQSLKINQLENHVSNLREDLRERNKQQVAQVVAPPSRTNVDVFELSQVIEANNIASENLRRKELEEQRKALVRAHLLKVEGEISKVENKYRPVINKIKELESHLEAQKQFQQKETPARLLWISCQALLDRMRFEPQGPLEKEPAYDVLKKFAANDNPLAINVLDSIPAKALKEGVQSEESLIARYFRIEKICKRVALVGENGGGIAKYLISYLQSLLIFDNAKVTEDEVAGRLLVDPSTWNTFDILARVRYCLLRHNLEQATRYANQLRGQARVVARDWIRDARVYLETKQAFSALSTHAEAVAIDSIRQSFVE